MKKHNKQTAIATTSAGHQMKVRIDRRDNTALPTNWRQQASILANQGKMRPKGAKESKRA